MSKQNSEMVYAIQDSNGRYAPSIGLSAKYMDGTGSEWSYYSQTHATHGSINRENTELKIQKLRELNALAGFDVVDWKIVELSQDEFMELAQKGLAFGFENGKVELKDVKTGCVTSHKKIVRDIHKEHKVRTLENVA
jgi:hypothetical protein